MKTVKEYVKFYSVDDWASGFELKKAQEILDRYNKNYYLASTNVNDFIEIYNVQKYFDNNLFLNEWSEEDVNKYKMIVDDFKELIGRFFSKLSDDNIEHVLYEVHSNFYEDFWDLFEEQKSFKKVSETTFKQLIFNSNVSISSILKHKKIVQKYDSVIAEKMRNSQETINILVHHFFIKDSNYYLPVNFKDKDCNSTFENYVLSGTINPNYLELIFKSDPSSFRVDSMIKKKAKDKYEDYWSKEFQKGTCITSEITYSVKYGDHYSFEMQNENVIIEYERKWLEDNVDYPTILNNFLYLFNYWDDNWRISFISKKHDASAFESIFRNSGDRWYITNSKFDIVSNVSSLNIKAYYNFLKNKGIYLFDVIEWFFVDYLSQEFQAKGFSFHAPSVATMYLEKNRALASELDGVLKQFKMYVQYGSIDRKLLEISYEPILVQDIPSFILQKYAYADSKEIDTIMNLLFSNQTFLSYVESYGDYDTLYDLLIHEKVYVKDFSTTQLEFLRLLEKEDVLILENEVVKLNKKLAFLLKDLYYNEVLCLSYLEDFSDILNELLLKKYIKISSSLFSISEQNYINYMLNKNEYTNGPNLRNKYIHSTYSLDPNVQEEDFYELLKVIIAIVGKINEEFILHEEQMNGE